MKHVLAVLLLAGTVAIATGNTGLPTSVQNALTTIDTVPTKAQLDDAFTKSAQPPLQTLSAIAGDPAADVGVRLRAIHALAKYCSASPCASSDLAHQSVLDVIVATRLATSGSQVLLLRAAIETLGPMRVSGDVAILNPLLDHPSRDIRAATARALRDLCNPQAISPLRIRYSGETTDQVKLAISEALRILGQCS